MARIAFSSVVCDFLTHGYPPSFTFALNSPKNWEVVTLETNKEDEVRIRFNPAGVLAYIEDMTNPTNHVIHQASNSDPGAEEEISFRPSTPANTHDKPTVRYIFKFQARENAATGTLGQAVIEIKEPYRDQPSSVILNFGLVS